MDVLSRAFSRVLVPVASLLMSRNIRFGLAADWLKDAFVTAALRDFPIGGRDPTISRLSLLTGLQRKDLKQRLAQRSGKSPQLNGQELGLLPRIVAHWLGKAEYRRDDRGLPLRHPSSASFERLIQEISKDVHHRTVLDEMVRQGLARRDQDRVYLTQDAFVPVQGDEAQWSYLGSNLGDHAEAAASNLNALDKPPFFERAAHYGGLSASSIEELQELAGNELSRALARINTRALELQAADRQTASGGWRFRAGGYIFHASQGDSRQ